MHLLKLVKVFVFEMHSKTEEAVPTSTLIVYSDTSAKTLVRRAHLKSANTLFSAKSCSHSKRCMAVTNSVRTITNLPIISVGGFVPFLFFVSPQVSLLHINKYSSAPYSVSLRYW